MRALIRSYIFNLAAIYIAHELALGFTYNHKLETLLFGALVFMVINWFLKPIIKILMLPFNLLTLGLFSWLINSLMLFVLIKFVPQFTINAWKFSGINYSGYSLPAYNVSVLLTYFLVSFIIALIISFLNWLSK